MKVLNRYDKILEMVKNTEIPKATDEQIKTLQDLLPKGAFGLIEIFRFIKDEELVPHDIRNQVLEGITIHYRAPDGSYESDIDIDGMPAFYEMLNKLGVETESHAMSIQETQEDDKEEEPLL